MGTGKAGNDKAGNKKTRKQGQVRRNSDFDGGE